MTRKGIERVAKGKKTEQTVEVKLEPKAETKFSKQSILSSEKYENRRDLLSAVLEEDRMYEKTEIEKAIENFMKGKVN